MADSDSLVVSVEHVPVVSDRTEVQLSDSGGDSGESKDPS